MQVFFMKKLIVAAIVLAFIQGFASCNKTSQCECTFSALGTNIRVESYDDVSKSECKEAEEAGNKAGSGLVTVKCVFK